MKKAIQVRERPFSQKEYIPTQILGLSVGRQGGAEELHGMA